MPAPSASNLFHDHRARVYRWACAMGADDHGAFDVVQEVFSRLVAGAPALPDDRAALAWLRRATNSVVVDRWRADSARRQREQSHDLRIADALSPDQTALATEAATAVRDAVLDLSDMQRLVLTAKTVDALTFREIAAELGIAEPTAKTHYLRALQGLRAALDSSVHD